MSTTEEVTNKTSRHLEMRTKVFGLQLHDFHSVSGDVAANSAVVNLLNEVAATNPATERDDALDVVTVIVRFSFEEKVVGETEFRLARVDA